MTLVVKNPPANAGDIRDMSSIPKLGGSPGEGHGNPLQYSCCRIPWTEEPKGLQSMGATVHGNSQKQLTTHACTILFIIAVASFYVPTSSAQNMTIFADLCWHLSQFFSHLFTKMSIHEKEGNLVVWHITEEIWGYQAKWNKLITNNNRC